MPNIPATTASSLGLITVNDTFSFFISRSGTSESGIFTVFAPYLPTLSKFSTAKSAAVGWQKIYAVSGSTIMSPTASLVIPSPIRAPRKSLCPSFANRVSTFKAEIYSLSSKCSGSI